MNVRLVRLASKTPAPAGQRDDRQTRQVPEFEDGVAFRAEVQVAGPPAGSRDAARRGQLQPALVGDG